jgi:transposase
MDAYSMDLRERVIGAVDAGEDTREEIAQRFGVSSRWIRKLVAQRAATGSIAPRPHGGGRKAVIVFDSAEALRHAVQADPDATLGELRDAVGVEGSIMVVWRALKRLKITRKKSRSVPKSSLAPRSKPNALTG